MFTVRIISLLLGFISMVSLVHADSISLYDAALNDELPEVQSEYIFRSTYGVMGTSEYMTEGTDSFIRIDTIASNTTRYGYVIKDVAMDRTQGVNLDFTIRIYDSTVEYYHRGPFSIHINTSDKMGLELYFRADEIFSTNTDFFRRVSASYVTTGFVDYNLYISGDSFTLSANSTVILTDTLVNFPDDSIYFHDYPRISFGDGSAVASGIIDIASLSVYGAGVSSLLPEPEPEPEPHPIPEPLSVIMLVCSVLGAGVKRFFG